MSADGGTSLSADGWGWELCLFLLFCRRLGGELRCLPTAGGGNFVCFYCFAVSTMSADGLCGALFVFIVLRIIHIIHFLLFLSFSFV